MVTPSSIPTSPEPSAPAPSPSSVSPTPLPGAPTSPLPALSPDDRGLLAIFIQHDLDLLWAHTLTTISVDELLAWSTRPDIAAHLAAYEASRHRSLKLMAMAALQEVLESTPSPIEKRRAASALIRALCASSSPSRPRPPHPPTSDPSSPRSTFSILTRAQAESSTANGPAPSDASFTPSPSHRITVSSPVAPSPSHRITPSSPDAHSASPAPDTAAAHDAVPYESELRQLDHDLAIQGQSLRAELAAADADPKHPANNPAYRRRAQSILASISSTPTSRGGSHPFTASPSLPLIASPLPPVPSARSPVPVSAPTPVPSPQSPVPSPSLREDG